MSQAMLKQQVLMALIENFNKDPNHGLMDSGAIASELDMTIAETRHIIKSMNGTGVIESTLEGDYSIITKKGIDWLNR